MSNFSIFSIESKKKSLRVRSESTRVDGELASYLLRVKSKLGSGQGPSLQYGNDLWQNRIFFLNCTYQIPTNIKLLRLAVKDWGRLLPRDMLDTLGRVLPGQLALASIIINTFHSGKPKRLYDLLNVNRYTIRRTGKIRFYDSSRRKVGRHYLGNGIDDIVMKFCDKWLKTRTWKVRNDFISNNNRMHKLSASRI